MTGTNVPSETIGLTEPRRGLWAAVRAASRLFGVRGPRSSEAEGDAINPQVEMTEVAPEEAAPNPEAVFAAAVDLVSTLRTLFSDISRAPTPARAEVLQGEMLKQGEALKALATLPELDSVHQMAAALSGMLEALKGKSAGMTPSVMRTVAAALALMEALCVPGRRADLDNPPVKLLAVDDDPISRIAVTVALKKVFSQPADLVSFPWVGLDLAKAQRYDLIFLDIEMPEMTGFDLCAQIQKTEFNRTTPVLFVTNHGDQESRALSASLGAQALVPKPFMSFELALKALTLVLRGRLDSATKAATGAVG